MKLRYQSFYKRHNPEVHFSLLVQMGEKNLKYPDTYVTHWDKRHEFWRKPDKFSKRAWFDFAALLLHDARIHLYPLWRWFEMVMVIDLNIIHYTYHQKQWKKAVTKRQMNAHNKITERIVNSLEENLQLIIGDRIAWQSIK